MKDIVYEKAHTTKLEENFELFSINPNKSLESTKNIVKLFIDNLLLSKVDARNMITVQEIENYIINLLEN
jgi:maleate cis-trans isomerase